MALALGSPAPRFSLPATNGSTYTFDDLKGEAATVIMFWCNHCPYVIPNQDRVIAMQEEYRDRGVSFAAICSNSAATHPADSFENMKRRALEKGYNLPYLHDDSQDVARAFGAERTPEVFAFDADGLLRYHGRIDDNHEDVELARSHDLRGALDSMLAGTSPDPAETGALGCTIKWK